MSKTNYEKFLKILKDNNFQRKIDRLVQKYKNKKIIIYAAGLICNIIFDNFDLSGLNILAVADKRYKDNNEFYRGIKAISPEDIFLYNPDIVLITSQQYFDVEDYFQDVLFKKGKIFKYKSLLVYDFWEFLLKLLKLPI